MKLKMFDFVILTEDAVDLRCNKTVEKEYCTEE